MHQTKYFKYFKLALMDTNFSAVFVWENHDSRSMMCVCSALCALICRSEGHRIIVMDFGIRLKVMTIICARNVFPRDSVDGPKRLFRLWFYK